MAQDPTPRYDVVIVGARVAGAGTALLLARAGLRVLVLDRAAAGADTLSTHALTRGGVVLLRRWGVLDELIASDTPPVRRSTFHFDDERIAIDMKPRDGIDALYAPRRTVLDVVLAAAAQREGAVVRHDCRVTSVRRDGSGRVVGVGFSDSEGRDHEVDAALTIGADGSRSLIAREVGAPVTWQGSHSGAMLYGYFPDPGIDGYHWCYAPTATAGIIPTNDESVCVWVGTDADRFMRELRGDLRSAFAVLMAEGAPDYVEEFPVTAARGRLFGHGGRVGHLRQPCGPGWALVGDAGYFKDPLTAHGITDALRDAELLAHAVVDSRDRGDEAYDEYRSWRDELSIPFAEVTDQIASYDWDTDGIKALVRREGKLLAEEADLFAGLAGPNRAATE